MEDSLIICKRCGEHTCYTQKITEDISTYYCIGCGFMTNSLMKEGSEFLTEQMSVLPEIYREISFQDDSNLIWIPVYINVLEKGMVFVQGTDSLNWNWVSVQNREIPEEERELYPDKKNPGTFLRYKPDNTTMKNFTSKEFVEAVSYIKVL